MKRLNVLISAYSCEPNRGSEPGVGWNMARAIAKHHNVWVLTRPDESKDAIEAELSQNPVPNLHIVYFTLPFWQDSMRWGQSGAMQIHYYLWQIQAYFVAQRLHRDIGFDVAHHVTFVKYSSPCFLSLLPIPLVWGPVGGGESAPRSFWKDFSLRAKAYELARLCVRTVGELDPFVRLTIRRSAVIRATTHDTARRLYAMGAMDVEIATESGLSSDEIDRLSQLGQPANAPVRFISMGRLLHWKGFYLGLRAFAEADLPNAEYWICGDGPEWDQLQQLAQDLKIESQVTFLGRLPREQVLEKLGQCHVLVHPSLHDSGGWVCLEAMAAGRPVLCLDLGGPAVQVTKDTGFKVSAMTPEQSIHDLADGMRQLAHDGDLRQRMGDAGKRLVQSFHSWESKGNELAHLYESLAMQVEKVSCVS
ncbi:glycosyltransferase [Thermoleptolyngbya oregonensis NK1-22]|uniref:Glycosyltransferase n=1 Tax=Thermoleptolyngbya oregonensis NK1-22 TaxID=2547457 RepID=A0AA97BD58_9CYAN|nr:glycosyltransferase [Thermoleptolyngbya oregonensis]WOB43929.1 glycosyltransferase [Thermoleptolyngbya oregonensis NK1-22]